MEGQEGEGGGAETWDPHPDCHSPATGAGPETGVWWGWPTSRAENIMVDLGALSSREACPASRTPVGRDH